jgi:hypothetical protein
MTCLNDIVTKLQALKQGKAPVLLIHSKGFLMKRLTQV